MLIDIIIISMQKNERVEDLNGFIVRHKYHVKQLEVIVFKYICFQLKILAD